MQDPRYYGHNQDMDFVKKLMKDLGRSMAKKKSKETDKVLTYIQKR